MTKSLSVFLDAARFLAAVLVFLDHYSDTRFTAGLLYQLRDLGPPAVDVFFVLSGFVIAHVTLRPGADARGYALDRAARILSVTVPALVLTAVLDHIGAGLRPEVYRAVDFSTLSLLHQYAAGLSFLNESWLVGPVWVGSNGPYWSMGYEVPYYAAFGLAAFGPGWWRVIGPLTVLLLTGPMVAALFPVWLLGVGTYHLSRRVRLAPLAGLALAGAVLAGAAAWCAWCLLHHALPGYEPTRAGPLLSKWPDYIVGIGFAAVLLGVHAAAPLLDRHAARLARPVATAAGITLTLYLTHVPLMAFLRAVSPWDAASPANQMFVLAGTSAAVVALAQVGEHRKRAWRQALAALFVRRPLHQGNVS